MPIEPDTKRRTPAEREFMAAFHAFQRAASHLATVWQSGDIAPDIFGDTYPKCLPSFDEFSSEVQDMDPFRQPKPTLPQLPPVGTILRARYDLDMGGHGRWPKGWTGEIVDIEPDAQHVSVQCHRYLGPNLHEWDNSRVISFDDAHFAYENDFDRNPADDDQPLSGVLAYALFNEFEEC